MLYRINIKIVVTLLLVIIYNVLIFSQTTEKNKLNDQYYIEDSAYVYWTIYPNPFSPPKLTDTSKGLFCGQYTFYCTLSDTVLIAFQNERDSILYSKEIISESSPNFSFCLWIAGPHINHKELPKYYFQSNGKEMIKIILIVNGSKKCYRETYASGKRYYWIR